MAATRRRKIGHRRRVEDEGEDDAAPEALDADDDSLTDGSLATDDHGTGDDSDTSNVDETSPTSPPGGKKAANGNAPDGQRKPTRKSPENNESKTVSDTEMMLQGLSVTEQQPVAPPKELHFDDAAPPSDSPSAPVPSKSPSAPVVVSSASAARQSDSAESRRRQEHDNYRRRRDEDPAFVPNRGSFFMHDHRHAGPAANGFRPFGRGRGRGRGGRGGVGVGGPFSPMNQMHHRPGDPTTSSTWTHDMHEVVAEPTSRRTRQVPDNEGPPNGTGFIPTREPNPTPINRSLSTEKHIGNVQVRIFLAHMKSPIVKPGIPVKQYTKLPDHRPPLRRDKPVRISLPNRPPRYIYPAIDRSFIFIPRAMRPNQQQRTRGKGRSGLGSIGGMSRRTSVFGGSYYGSMYSPSVAVSRRSSIAHDRDMMFSPTGSVISRSAAVPPPGMVENPRPVVRLPPAATHPDIQGAPAAVAPDQQAGQGAPPPAASGDYTQQLPVQPQPEAPTQPQAQAPVQQKPHYLEKNRAADLPMHQPRPQKNISVAHIESPTMAQGQQPFQQAFHHQMPPIQATNGYRDSHARNPSFMSQHSSGTPLSHIPERAIHAEPFQPHTAFGQPQQPYYGHQGYQSQPQGGYYYPPAAGYSNPAVGPQVPGQVDRSAQMNSNLVAQEANGMVYYYDPSQVAQVNSYPGYSAPPQGYQPGVMGMGGMVTPSPDGYYYPQGTSGMMYYPQQ